MQEIVGYENEIWKHGWTRSPYYFHVCILQLNVQTCIWIHNFLILRLKTLTYSNLRGSIFLNWPYLIAMGLKSDLHQLSHQRVRWYLKFMGLLCIRSWPSSCKYWSWPDSLSHLSTRFLLYPDRSLSLCSSPSVHRAVAGDSDTPWMHQRKRMETVITRNMFIIKK